jgi:Uma2 family endonuclease
MTTTANRTPHVQSAEEWLRGLGDVPPHRIRMIPYPGTATEADAVRVSKTECLCELVDGTLVEKAMGVPESFLASILISMLWPTVRQSRLGVVCGTDGMFRMIHGNIRELDVSFTRRERLPNPMPQIGGWCPDLCIEVLSPANTRSEMALKRSEYFPSGCRLVWEIDPRSRTAMAYTADDAGSQVDTLDGGSVVPGFTLSLAQLFAEFDAALPPAAP